jgi:hypothetical protein
LFFLLCIIDLTKITSTDTKIFLYADNTSLIVTNPNLEDFKITMNEIFLEIDKWFKANLISLNLKKKTLLLQFTTKSCHNSNTKISYNSKYIYNTTSTKFLGLIIDDNLSWKNHIDYLLSKLNSACCAIRTVKSVMSQDALGMIYFSYVHSIITYGIILWGNSPYSRNNFRVKKIIRIITNKRNRVSCRESFKKMKMLPLYSQYIFSLLLYTVNNKQLFISNREIHNISTRSSINLHPPTSNLTKFQKGAYYFGIKIFNLPTNIKCLTKEVKLFRPALKRFLYTNSFYSFEEYFNHN